MMIIAQMIIIYIVSIFEDNGMDPCKLADSFRENGRCRTDHCDVGIMFEVEVARTDSKIKIFDPPAS